MQTAVSATTPSGRTVVGWLHRAKPDNGTVVVLCHGHNDTGARGRFIEMAKWLVSGGVDVLRWSVTRTDIAPQVSEVTTPSQEIEQAVALVGQFREQYQHIVAAGHSQGGITCLALGRDGLAEGIVQIMSVADTPHHSRRAFKRYAAALNAAGFAPFLTPSGTFGYTQDFFDDYRQWDVLAMLAKNDKPLLFIEATNDDSLREGEVRDGFAAASGPKELFTVHDGHHFSSETAAAIAKKMLSWMHEHRLC